MKSGAKEEGRKKFQWNSWVPLLFVSVLLVASSIGIQKYEHIDPTFWKALVYFLAPFPSAYFILWHLKNNSHKTRSQPGYSLVPGVLGAIFISCIISIPFSGLLLLANAAIGTSIVIEQVYLKEKWESGRHRQFNNVHVDRIETGGHYKFEVPYDMYLTIQPGKKYLMKYKRGLFGVRYLDRECSLQNIGK